ncbi:MAG: ribosome assembly cofactor RimP [Bacteroidales bacterium]|jgi:ribosome maturation factor RimP|nr:ribosome assembly cofactor RimP [Bacteroidales bacterium]
MKDKNFIEEKVKEILGEGELFLVEVKVSKNNNIQVFIDGDNGVKIQDCIDLSRQLEECLDRESEDFELSVLSFGLEEPLKMQRQYVKNIGRSLQVEDEQGSFTGTLISANEESFTIELKKKGKKNIENENKKTYNYKEIKSAKVVISFK